MLRLSPKVEALKYSAQENCRQGAPHAVTRPEPCLETPAQDHGAVLQVIPAFLCRTAKISAWIVVGLLVTSVELAVGDVAVVGPGRHRSKLSHCEGQPKDRDKNLYRKTTVQALAVLNRRR